MSILQVSSQILLMQYGAFIGVGLGRIWFVVSNHLFIAIFLSGFIVANRFPVSQRSFNFFNF